MLDLDAAIAQAKAKRNSTNGSSALDQFQEEFKSILNQNLQTFRKLLESCLSKSLIKKLDFTYNYSDDADNKYRFVANFRVKEVDFSLRFSRGYYSDVFSWTFYATVAGLKLEELDDKDFWSKSVSLVPSEFLNDDDLLIFIDEAVSECPVKAVDKTASKPPKKSCGDKPLSEITYREHLASVCLQGILANSDYPGDIESAAGYSIKCADLLIERLDNPPPF
jgi:hypothetical protein